MIQLREFILRCACTYKINIENIYIMSVLFYSNKCQSCVDLLIILKNENLLNHFKLVCVDDKLDKLPQTMIVPTMIIPNINKPLAGQETFEWVNRVKFLRQQQQTKVLVNNVVDDKKRGPMGYDQEIMGNVSDKFAFTQKDDALPQSYVGVNDKHAIFTAPTDKKISKSEQMKLTNDLESKRNEQDTSHSKIMREEQANAIMRTEYDQFAQSIQPKRF